MSESKHLKYFKVENFKCFDSFEMDDIGQFNLIAGDNNVGKTSALEAIMTNTETSLDKVRYSLLMLIHQRFPSHLEKDKSYNIPVLSRAVRDRKKENSFSITYQLDGSNRSKRKFKAFAPNEITDAEVEAFRKRPNFISSEPVEFIAEYIDDKLNDVLGIFPTSYQKADGVNETNKTYLRIVRSFDLYGLDLVKYYSYRIQDNYAKRQDLINALRIFIPEIVDIEPSIDLFGDKVILNVKTVDHQLRPLAFYGEGAIKFSRILLEIVYNEDNILCIDEIDSGIHYSKLSKFWEAILLTASSNNVQLFATTHSLECMKYFKEALEDENMKEFRNDARYFALSKTKEGPIKSYSYDFNQFENALELGNEIR